MMPGKCSGGGYGSGGGKAKTFNSILEYCPYMRRKSIIIIKCTQSFVHRTLV